MKREDLWQHLVGKNPHWEHENVTFTPEGLHKFYDTVYNQAHKQGVSNGKALSGKAQPKRSTSGEDVIKGLFGL